MHPNELLILALDLLLVALSLRMLRARPALGPNEIILKANGKLYRDAAQQGRIRQVKRYDEAMKMYEAPDASE